jgi:hypothetical protein
LRSSAAKAKCKVRWAIIGSTALLLAAGNNQYGAPVDGQPLTWGQKHYQDNQRYQEMVEQGRAD